jgi:Mlc titration factor MtfA (ptsG expression regulator)
MLFRWLKRRRRRDILAQPFPSEWTEWLEENVVQYSRLDAALQRRLRDLTQVFVAEKHWEGLEGLEISWEMQVTIAALASLLLLGREDLDFDHVLSILVYPDMYLARQKQVTEFGLVTEGREARLGEAWYRGPVILSWEDVLMDARQEERGFNVVLHEFAHQLDMANGQAVDGTPPLRRRSDYARWSVVMTSEFDQLVERCRRRRPGVLDCYGASEPSEFFAVATEAFFERPYALRNQSPALYETLQQFYEVNPAEWRRDDAGWDE